MNTNQRRARIRLSSQEEVLAFIQALSQCEDAFSIENRNGMHRVNAKSVIGVMYSMFDFQEDMYLVNDTNADYIPPAMDAFRALPV